MTALREHSAHGVPVGASDLPPIRQVRDAQIKGILTARGIRL